MMLNILFNTLALGFATIAVIGHVLVFQAILRGRAEQAPPARPQATIKADTKEAVATPALERKRAA